jgi:hypothetical protein
MEIKDILDYIVQNGIGVVCVVYMIYFQNTTMKEMLNTLKGIDTRLTIIENNINKKVKND